MVNELVKKLSDGKHDVTIANRGESYKEIEERLTKLKYIYIMFPNTQGGTELGIKVDIDNCRFTDANFTLGKGSLHIEGTANLNYSNVRCIADVELKTKKGKGYLVVEDN